jgi:hypothetical protein
LSLATRPQHVRTATKKKISQNTLLSISSFEKPSTIAQQCGSSLGIWHSIEQRNITI